MELHILQVDSPAYRKMLEAQFRFFEEKFAEIGNRVTNESTGDWVSVSEAMKLLGIGRTKLQEMKNGGLIAFTQYKKTLRFSRKSIEQFLRKHSTL